MNLINANIPHTDMLYRFAIDCATHKYRGNCDLNCSHCPSNISLYGLSPRDAVMMQHSAELEVKEKFRVHLQYLKAKHKYNQQIRADNIREARCWSIITVILLIPCIWAFTVIVNTCSAKPGVVSAVEVEAANMPSDSKERRDALTGYIVDGQDEINCIDRAIAYYERSTNKSNVRIIHGKSSHDENKNHLWIRINGVDIEPYVLLEDYWPEDDWKGAQRIDVTDNWRAIKEGRFNWDNLRDADYRRRTR